MWVWAILPWMKYESNNMICAAFMVTNTVPLCVDVFTNSSFKIETKESLFFERKAWIHLKSYFSFSFLSNILAMLSCILLKLQETNQRGRDPLHTTQSWGRGGGTGGYCSQFRPLPVVCQINKHNRSNSLIFLSYIMCPRDVCLLKSGCFLENVQTAFDPGP